jgi:uncharacterized protein YodC (DUF2158 family)
MTAPERRVFGFTIMGEVAHVPSGGPGVTVCGMRIDYEREGDERPKCRWCQRGVKRGRAQELRRIRKAAA